MRNSPTADQNTLYMIRYIHGQMSSPTSQIIVHHIMRDRDSRLSSSTSQRNFVIDDTDWMGIIFYKYSTHSYSNAHYKSVRMQTINISKRASSQSTHNVPKRRRLAPCWDVVDDGTPHQLVRGEAEDSHSTKRPSVILRPVNVKTGEQIETWVHIQMTFTIPFLISRICRSFPFCSSFVC